MAERIGSAILDRPLEPSEARRPQLGQEPLDELEVTAFGMQVFNLPPHFDQPFSAHRHRDLPPELAFADHGQEEVYVPLRGRGTLIAGDDRWELVPGMAVRVGPAQ